MKNILACLLAAALLAGLCSACKKQPDEDPAIQTAQTQPEPEPVALLTLHADANALRIVTQKKDVIVTLQKLEYEPTLAYLHPVADEWKETLQRGKEYKIDKELAEGIPAYRLLVQQGDNIAFFNLTYDGKDGTKVFEIEGKPWAPAPISEDSPMINLCRAASVASSDMENLSYWFTIANAISTLRSVYLELPPDEDSGTVYVPAWLFQAYAQALYPDIDLPAVPDDCPWVSYHPESPNPYGVASAYSTWIWSEFQSAKQQEDGSWELLFTLSGDEIDGIESVIKLEPNEAYNPGSPFEYHIAGLPVQPPEPAPPPPDIVVGTWKASLGKDEVCYLELYADGMAGLYKGDAKSDKLYEIYLGNVLAVDEASGTVTLDMDFNLDWHHYEGEGELDPAVPEAYNGTYTLRHAWEGNQQVLHTAAKSGDALFGKKELKMAWVPKTLGGGTMVEIEAMG